MKILKFVVIIILGVFLIGDAIKTYDMDQRNQLLERELTTTQADLESAQGKITALQNNMWIKASKEDVKKAEEDMAHNLATGLEELKTDLTEKNKQEIAGLENKIFDPTKIYLKVKDSVVGVSCGGSTGTGFLYHERNLIVTAYHVLNSPPGTEVVITPYLKPNVMGRVKKIAPDCDLALIELSEPLNAEPLKATRVADTSERVLVMGNAAGLGNAVSTGVVSGTSRTLGELSLCVQIDAAVYHGSSGGPVINKNCEVIGVVSQSLSNGFVFSFAIPGCFLIGFVEE